MRLSTSIATSLLAASLAAGPAPASAGGVSASILASGRTAKGRPAVKLDHLEFPTVHGGARYKSHLRKTLRKEVRRADWGAGRGAKIEYRFRVKELKTVQKGSLLRVTCSAMGELPKGKTAKSRLSFGGDPRKQKQLVHRVLEIVARGVITRLAEMERVRRGDLRRERVRTPSTG